MKKYLKYGLIIGLAAILLVGITLIMNSINSTEGTSNYYRSLYSGEYDKQLTLLNDETKNLETRYNAFNSLYVKTKEALELKSKDKLNKEEKIITKVYTKEKFEKVVDNAAAAVKQIKGTEEYMYHYGLDKNGNTDPNYEVGHNYITLYQTFENTIAEADRYVTENTKKYTILDALIDSLFCMTVVFGILIILWLIIECFKFIKPKNAKAEKIEKKSNMEVVEKIKMEDITDPDMMVAALTATIDYANTGARDVKLVSIKERK